MKLRNLKKLPYEIASFLASQPEINSLLTIDTSDALKQKSSLTAQELIDKEYVSYGLITDNDLKRMTRNTFLVINVESINLFAAENNILFSGAIYISTDKAHEFLDGGRLRLLELADIIETKLQNEKFSAGGVLDIHFIDSVIFSEYRRGYRLSFRCYDQLTKKAEL